MKQLLETSNVSLVQSLRVALDAEGIGAVIGNEAMSPLQPMTVQVADTDFERAHAVLVSLQVTPARFPPSRVPFMRSGWLAFVALLILLLAVWLAARGGAT